MTGELVAGAVLGGFAGGVVVLFLNMLVALPFMQRWARRRLERERAAFARTDAKTWRPVKPALLGVQAGSISWVAGTVQAEAPIGPSYQFRTREVADLDVGTVRVSFEVGARYHQKESET